MDYNRSNDYEMRYMNPATGQPGHPPATSNTNYGFQYNNYTPPGGNPPKYEDVMGNAGYHSYENAYPSAPAILEPTHLEQDTNYDYFPRSSQPFPDVHRTPQPYPRSPSHTEPHPTAQPQPQTQVITVPVQKKKKSKCGRIFVYVLIRFVIAVIIGGIIRGIVYAAYG